MSPEKFAKNIGVEFDDITVLQTAFTHRSYINEHRHEAQEHNERLEFLGDAVLELVVTDFLYEKFPEEPEGSLTSYRAGLVNTSTLSTVATKLGMNDYLRLSKGEAKDEGRARRYILANTFEAVVGAIYIDQGYDAAQEFIAAHIFPLTDDVVGGDLWHDAKSHFQEKAQEHEGITPTYEVKKQEGPDHSRKFTIAVMLGEEEVALGEGKSKREAEQKAARKALQEKNWN